VGLLRPARAARAVAGRLRSRARPTRALVATLALLPASSGCFAAATWLAMPFLYERAELPSERVLRDIAYRSDAGADPAKHRLDLFLPEPSDAGPWPVLVFVHGGGWTRGDRAERVAGRDVYANIGRFFAARGIASAVISYRLQFDVTWQDQVEDVARAVAWVHDNAARYGGDPDALFLAGHSAGAQLAARVALDADLAAHWGAPRVCGLIPVSGAGFDLADEQTYALGAEPDYYERRFRNGDPGDAWKYQASPVRFVGDGAPATLVLYAEDDWPALHRQAELLDAALRAAGARSRLVELPGEDHYTVVLALSREDGPATHEMLEFIHAARAGCQP
jgi:acetyl esterase/lipase